MRRAKDAVRPNNILTKKEDLFGSVFTFSFWVLFIRILGRKRGRDSDNFIDD
jgi:hypothetical protein